LDFFLSTFAIIEDSGHMIPIEAPQALAEVLVPWLESVSALRAG